ncbi:MAG: ATP synthase F0 subunit C [Bacteriovoracaceae bacterium]|jgi:F-type H+-transporting ATPase subunit c|nr:ATP synthase F0 subunit C [Bacteriovoracaceae bacterium]
MKKLLFVLVCLTASASVLAEGTAPSTGGELRYFAYFFAVAIAALGGTQAQSRAASTALEGIARNPAAADKLQTPMILGLALMESLVIFTLISVFLTGSLK